MSPWSTSWHTAETPPPLLGSFAPAPSSSHPYQMPPSAPSSWVPLAMPPPPPTNIMQAGRGPHPRRRRRRCHHRVRVRLRRVPRRTRQPERRPHEPVHQVHCRPLAHGALSVEDEVTNVSPATCSAQCLNLSVTSDLCSVFWLLGVHKACTLESMPISQDSLLPERPQRCSTLWTSFSCGWTLVQKGPPWPPPVQLERLLSMVFCCSVRKCKMKLLKGGIRDLIMLSNMISKHRAYALCIHGKISWPPPILVWSSDQHQFNKSTCLWRDSLMCYSYLIIKFNFSGCLQSICLDQRNEVDKFQLDVKIFITNYSDYWTTVAPNSIWGSEVKIYTIICMLDRFKCNGAMANSFRVFLLSPLVQSINSALIVWPGDLQLLVELKQCANKKKSKVHQRSLNLLGCII